MTFFQTVQIYSQLVTGHDLIWSHRITMIHKRNNEGAESQRCEQLSKPLLLISAGSLETDKLFFFLLNQEQMSQAQNICGWASIHLPYLEQLSSL